MKQNSVVKKLNEDKNKTVKLTENREKRKQKNV